jgi:hypothetical protein
VWCWVRCLRTCLSVRWLRLEEFVVRVFSGGKVTVPKRFRELFGVDDGCYVRLVLVEVMRKDGSGGWVKTKVS